MHRTSLLTSLALVLGNSSLEAETPAPLNFVVIVADDLGWADIGANNPDCFYDTPHVDRLAASGTRFRHGYAANPVCSPTRFSLMTGRYPSRADVTNWFSGKRVGNFKGAPFHERMALEEVTLAEAVVPAGYSTFFAGKWHQGPNAKFWPQAQGFGVNRGGHSGGGPYGGKKYFSPYGNPRLDDGPDGEHLPDRLARETVSFMREKKGSPFLAYLAFYSVHTPLMAPKDLVAKYKAKRLGMEGPEFAEEEQVLPKAGTRRVRIQQRHAIYGGMVEAMDRAVGTVLDGIEELGLQDNTVVIFTSDHGGLATSEGHPTSNLPFRCGKGWVYEGGLRVPFVVRWPGATTPGSVSDAPVMSIDLFPTLIGQVAPDATSHCDGQDILPLLRGETTRARPLFWHYPHYANQGGFPGGAVRVGTWKLIERYEDGRVHLYDLATDPGERKDLAAEQPQRVAAMRRQLHEWYIEVDAKFLEQKPGGAAAWRPKVD